MITIERASYRFPDHDQLFDPVTFDVSPGDAVAVIGHNGVGKTTLLRLLADEILPTAGRIIFRENLRITFVPTVLDCFLLPWYSIKKNISFFCRGSGSMHRDQAVRAALDRLMPELGLNEARKVHVLSTGQKAVLGLACALATNPQVLLLDELFGNLGVSVLPLAINEIQSWLSQGGGVAFTSHEPGVVAALATKKVALL